MGVGSSYITLQTYGGTLLGFIIAIGAGIGLLFANTNKGKLLSIAFILIGGGLMYTSSRIRQSAQEDDGFEGVGTILLGFAAIGVIGRLVMGFLKPEPLEPRGGFDPQVREINEEQSEVNEESESDGATDNETEV